MQGLIEAVDISKRMVRVTKRDGMPALTYHMTESDSGLIDGVEVALDESDRYASENEERYTHEEVFVRLQRRIKESVERNNEEYENLSDSVSIDNAIQESETEFAEGKELTDAREALETLRRKYID